ncbi:MAG: tetratricopeptide repeat protein [Deltaproteobacteria bacterium]|nr:tetratricopeptide repeat protein [Deltaproteobacteria bacterium]
MMNPASKEIMSRTASYPLLALSGIIIPLLLCCACATTPIQKDDAFSIAVESFQDESYVEGARAAWQFVDAADPDDPRYDRGLKLVAAASEKLGMTFIAAMMYRQIAMERRNMEVVPEALYGLKRIVETHPYSEDLLVTSFIAAETFSELPADVRAFVNYHQGLDLVRRGSYEWAEQHFSQIPETDPYFFEAEYVRAVRLVADGDYPKAIQMLKKMLEEKGLSRRTRTNAHRTLARLAFEEKRYKDALLHFDMIRELAPNDPDILIESAWTYFYLGDSRKTLGLLVALDAPVHRRHISPERYLLEALALRRLCQFGAARAAATKLERRYGESIRKLSEGYLPSEIEELQKSARYLTGSRDSVLFVESLNAEKKILEYHQEELGESLYTFLNSMYQRGMETAKASVTAQMEDDLNQLAEELLASREGVRLIIHELGVSLLRGRRRPQGAAEKPAFEIPKTGQKVFYSFDSEYWTDELDDLMVVAEDRCID